jgi:pimeloyl-ACP methyl ester carboxylesterase
MQLRDKINSIAFNYSGVAGSGDTLENSSLQGRIDETIAVLRWIETQSTQKQNITLFVSSMGGYIGLGTTDRVPQLVNNIILYAPAAYSANAHHLKFNGSFTTEIRKNNSWETSLSFDWFKKIQQPILMFTAENDEIIPQQLTARYLVIGKDKPLFTHIPIPHCSHNCWGDDDNSKRCRDLIFQNLLKQVTQG